MEKVAKKIEEELLQARTKHEATVKELSEALESVDKIRGSISNQETEMQRLSMEWETALYGAPIPEFVYAHTEEIAKKVEEEMNSSTYYIGTLQVDSGNSFYIPLFDANERDLGELSVLPRRTHIGEVHFDIVYHRKDTTGRVRTYRDFEMTSGIFDETLDLRRAIYAAIRHVLAQEHM